MVKMSRQIAKLEVIKIPSNTITKKQNQTLNVEIIFTYVGPAQRVTFTAVVTQDIFLNEFDEIGSTKKAVYLDMPASSTPQGWVFTISGLPLAGVEPKSSAYGVKVKAEGTFGTVEAGNKSCLYVQAPAGISFYASITGTPSWGSYDHWMGYYFDPGIGDFVGDSKWHAKGFAIVFTKVQPGGYFTVFLARGSEVSPQYTSPTFQAVEGGNYQYNVQTGTVTKIG